MFSLQTELQKVKCHKFLFSSLKWENIIFYFLTLYNMWSFENTIQMSALLAFWYVSINVHMYFDRFRNYLFIALLGIELKGVLPLHYIPSPLYFIFKILRESLIKTHSDLPPTYHPLASTSQIAEIINMHHHTQPESYYIESFIFSFVPLMKYCEHFSMALTILGKHAL